MCFAHNRWARDAFARVQQRNLRLREAKDLPKFRVKPAILVFQPNSMTQIGKDLGKQPKGIWVLLCEQCRYAGGLNTSEAMHSEEFQEDKSDGIL